MGETVGDKATKAKEVGREASDAVRDAAGEAADAAKDAARKTVDAAKTAARDTTEAVRSAGRETADAAQEAGRGVSNAGPYEQWTKDDLYERAQELDIEGRSEMDKDQLIRALRAS